MCANMGQNENNIILSGDICNYNVIFKIKEIKRSKCYVGGMLCM